MLQDKKGHTLRINKLLEYTGAQQIYVEIKDKFRKRHNYTLMIRYTSKLGREYEGFYISSYINKDDERRYIVTIQLYELRAEKEGTFKILLFLLCRPFLACRV